MARALLIFVVVAVAVLALWSVLQYFFSDDDIRASIEYAIAAGWLVSAVVFARQARCKSREPTAEAVRTAAHG